MPIIDKRDRNNWYNSIPVERPPKRSFLDDPNFSVDKMKGNEIEAGPGIIFAKIPEIKGRIYRRHDKDRNKTYIVLIADRYPDPANPKNTISERVIIGTELFGQYAGLMEISENYHEYFNIHGTLFNDPMKRRKEREERERAEQEARANAEEAETAEKATEKKTAEAAEEETAEETEEVTEKEEAARPPSTTAQPGTHPPTQWSRDEERTVDEIKASLLEQEKRLAEKEESLNEELMQANEVLRKLYARQEELDQMIRMEKAYAGEAVRQHINLLHSMLQDYKHIATDQAKRKPDMFMRAVQIRTINEILSELREILRGTEAEDYLHLAEEPVEEDLKNHPGTTYGEMAILLSAYSNAVLAFKCDNLYLKTAPKDQKNEEEDTDESE